MPEYGGGSLWDIGIYPVSLAQFLMVGGGLPEFVVGFQQKGPSGVDEQFFGQLCYPKGKVAQISASFQLPYHTQAQIFGTNGRLLVERPFTNIEPPNQKVIYYSNNGEPEAVNIPQEYLYLGEIVDMHKAILDGESNYLSLSETRNHVATVVALYQSASSGEVVWLE